MPANNIVEFPEAHLDAAKSDAAAFKQDGPSKEAPKWRFDHGMVSNSHFDASEGAFLARQLEHIRAGLQEIQYTELVYDRLMPINRSVPSTSREYTVRIMDKVGEAVIVAENADTIPNVEMHVTEKSMKFFMIALGYQYTVDEVRAAMAAGSPLLATKAMVCRQQIERKVNDVALIGDTFAGTGTGGSTGLLTATDSGVLTYTATTGSGSGDTEFEGKNSDEILSDLHGMTAKVNTDSKGVFSVNTLLLPLSTRTYLASRRVGDGTNGSILSYFIGADPFINSEADVVGLWQLESASAAGAGSTWTGKRAMAYRRDPGALELMISQGFEQLPPQALNFYVRTLARMKMGGLAIYQPATIIRLDQV